VNTGSLVTNSEKQIDETSSYKQLYKRRREYLDYPKNNIREFLGNKKIQALFIPYAAVTFSYDAYEEKVRTRFREVGHDVVIYHTISLIP
jgi:peptidase E